MSSRTCPNCGSDRVRRGGNIVWGVYVLVVMLAVPAVLVLHLNAAIVAAVMLAIIFISHLVLDAWWCAECGHQWRG